jgi:hypothetical protein
MSPSGLSPRYGIAARLPYVPLGAVAAADRKADHGTFNVVEAGIDGSVLPELPVARLTAVIGLNRICQPLHSL